MQIPQIGGLNVYHSVCLCALFLTLYVVRIMQTTKYVESTKRSTNPQMDEDQKYDDKIKITKYYLLSLIPARG